MIEIAGDMLEGGGQIVRTTVALAALTNKEVRITKIRDKRPNPGLQAQHVTAVRAVAAVAGAETEGLFPGSKELMFRPRGHVAGRFSFNVGTAGSVPLILQAVMPSAAYAPGQVEFELIGGTDVPWSPTVDYVRLVELPVLQLMGYGATLTVHRRGHYPKGGGRVTMLVDPPRTLNAVNLLERGVGTDVKGISHCVKLPSHVAQRQADAAKEKLSVRGIHEVNIAIETYPSTQDPHLAPGSGIALAMRFTNGSILGADSIGERGKPAERVGDEAASKLLKEFDSKAALDRHMGDMIIPYLAVAEGRSEIEVSAITTHTLTNIKVSEILAGVKFQIEGSLNEPGRISVEGIGLKA
ncbi:MAG: RNA 3'-terminal phosphate cyclase [Candidatus Bathyarchaeia archaeon]